MNWNKAVFISILPFLFFFRIENWAILVKTGKIRGGGGLYFKWTLLLMSLKISGAYGHLFIRKKSTYPPICCNRSKIRYSVIMSGHFFHMFFRFCIFCYSGTCSLHGLWCALYNVTMLVADPTRNSQGHSIPLTSYGCVFYEHMYSRGNY